MAGPLVTLEGVYKQFAHAGGPVTALDNVNLTVDPGTIQGVVGFSGSGKSTLLRCLCRLEKPDRGQVKVAGADLAALEGEALRQARKRIGVVFQQLHLLQARTVAANIALGLELEHQPDRAIQDRTRELLDWFGLSALADRYPSQLSGGQRQRVAIARALASAPAVLLTDEPTSAQDAETTVSVLRLLRRVRDELGVTVLLVTHELEAVRAICDRVAVLDHGRIAEEGPVSEVFGRPQSEAAKRLLVTTP
ncbi:MAG: ATP-binding cassette domain-containing protein [Acidobacteria bacterium]|nr:ATP-binding cassette domain-containing protein [Acidobacteriota bacterium]